MSEKFFPFVSVVVPVYRDWERLMWCLKALGEQTYRKESFEVIVINNGAKSDLPETLAADGVNIELLHEPTPGSDAARNTGLLAARGSIYAFTDSDCIPDPGWLENGVAFLLSQSGIGYIGGQIDLTFRGDQLTLAEVFEKAFAFRQEEIERGRRYAVTANLMVWRDVFKTIGPFDSTMVTGGDWEWGNRAAMMGYQIGYCETAKVGHPARHTLKEILRKRLRVSSGQYQAAKTTWYRMMIILVGFLPPAVPLWRLRGRKDLALSEKTKAVAVLYVMRITRSVSFILFALSIMKLRRS